MKKTVSDYTIDLSESLSYFVMDFVQQTDKLQLSHIYSCHQINASQSKEKKYMCA